MKKFIMVFLLILCGALCFGALTLGFKSAKDILNTETEDTVSDSSNSDTNSSDTNDSNTNNSDTNDPDTNDPDINDPDTNDPNVEYEYASGSYTLTCVTPANFSFANVNYTLNGTKYSCLKVVSDGSYVQLFAGTSLESLKALLGVNAPHSTNVVFDFGDTPQLVPSEFFSWVNATENDSGSSDTGNSGAGDSETDDIINDQSQLIGEYHLTKLADSESFAYMNPSLFTYNGVEYGYLDLEKHNNGLITVRIGTDDSYQNCITIISEQSVGSDIDFVFDFGDEPVDLSFDMISWIRSCSNV